MPISVPTRRASFAVKLLVDDAWLILTTSLRRVSIGARSARISGTTDRSRRSWIPTVRLRPFPDAKRVRDARRSRERSKGASHDHDSCRLRDPEGLTFPLNHLPAADARDWDAIHAWAEEVGEAMERCGNSLIPTEKAPHDSSGLVPMAPAAR